MNHNQIMYIIHIFSWFIQVGLMAYFYNNYLKAKNNKSLIYGIIINCLKTIFIIVFFYENTMMRSLLNIMCLVMIAILFYKDPLLKRISAGFIFTLFCVMSDFITIFIVVFIFNQDIYFELPMPLFMITIIVGHLFIFAFTKLFLILFKYDFNINHKFTNLYALFCVMLCVLFLLIGQSFIYNGLINHVDKAYQHMTMSIYLLLIVYVIMIIFIVRYMKYLNNEIKRNVLIQNTYNLYYDEYDQYKELKDENIKQMKYIRHDIMNYIQTLNTYKENQDES